MRDKNQDPVKRKFVLDKVKKGLTYQRVSDLYSKKFKVRMLAWEMFTRAKQQVAEDSKLLKPVKKQDSEGASPTNPLAEMLRKLVKNHGVVELHFADGVLTIKQAVTREVKL